MAKIHEEIIVIKLSKLTRSTEGETKSVVNDELLNALEQVVQELVEPNVIVEVENQS